MRRGTRLGAWNRASRTEEGGRRRGAARWRWRANATVGRGGEGGKQASEDPYRKAKLRQWLAATEEQRGGDGVR
jgi:hypothetical protein